jgi:pimeloyl-ACP methyl ester carboxylesterase
MRSVILPPGQTMRLPLLLAILLACACNSTPPLMESPRLEHGYVAIFGGPFGDTHSYLELADGLREGGVRGGIEIVDWGEAPEIWPADLHAAGVGGARVAETVTKITEYREEYPGNPVWLVGHSGGGGYALLVLEALPKGTMVEGVLLLAPAVSPDCNLAPLLRRTREGIWNYYSEADRTHPRSAGHQGFREPEGLTEADRDLYASQLQQIPFGDEMRMAGNDGRHWGWLQGRFARGYLAPILRTE